MKEVLSVLAGVIFILGFIPYMAAILRKETKPAKVSWLIWATIDTITFAGMAAAGTLNGQIAGALAGSWFVVALALRFGSPGWTLLDKLCLAGAALGILLWVLSHDPVLAIVTSLAVASIGSVPTIVSAWHHPERENRLAWILFWVSCVCATLAIPRWTLADAAQPITFLVIESIMMVLLFLKTR